LQEKSAQGHAAPEGHESIYWGIRACSATAKT